MTTTKTGNTQDAVRARKVLKKRQGEIRVSDPGVRERLTFLGLTEDDLGVIVSWKEICLGATEQLVDAFYSHVLGNQSTREILETHSSVEKQRPILTRYVQSLFEGRIDDRYIDDRRRVGATHDRIDLDGAWYVAMYGVMHRILTQSVREAGAKTAELEQFSDSLRKLFDVDIALCITALMDSRREKIEALGREQHERAERARSSVNDVVAAISAGRLDQRIDLNGFDENWLDLVEGVNQLIEAFVQPINVTAEYIERISKGDIPERITDDYKGDFNEIKNNLNGCIDVMNGLLEETGSLIEATRNGKFQARGAADKFGGGWGQLVGGVNELIEAFVQPINVTAEYIERISKGDIPERITDDYKGDFNEIKNNLNACIDAVEALLSDVKMLSQASTAGRLDTRANADKHQGDYRALVQGINETLDAILGPITEAADVLEVLKDYDLRARVKGEYHGDHQKIKDALNGTAIALDDSMGQVAEAVEQIASASGEISSSAQSVAQGASEQAASLEETAAAMEQMSSQIKLTAENSQQAKSLAQSAQSTAETGISAMERMLGAMDSIKESADDVSAIIKDINEIAFQTNLLALNAAVEAARAGDAGRGFAVVAEEVRNLALRAKDAATKTESLIAQSGKLADQGGTISGEVNQSLGEIMGSIGKVTDIISEIAVGSDEQAKGISEVTSAMGEMDKVVQQSAANSEESASAAEQLSSQAQELASMVGRFELSRNDGGGGGGGGRSRTRSRQGRVGRSPQHGGGNGMSTRRGASAQKAGPQDDDDVVLWDETALREF